MRTTLNIDEDVLSAIKDIAQAQRTSVGKVVSDLARKALSPRSTKPTKSRDGFPLFQFPRKKGTIVTLAMINKLRDEDE